MENLIHLWANVIIKNRLATGLVFIFCLALAVTSMIKFPLKYDNSFEMFMLKDDPNIVKFENFRNLFGDAEYVTIGIEARSNDPDLFVAETIKKRLEADGYVSIKSKK